ncbi:N-acetylmuramoyl-L-alanine amidase [Clostridiales bacterium oral taxon 876 str. F0540]|nr:N-acetylmuramoyl-L-alanine amidase [Clostridiales bacterium oral taxon 876 str. F0540]
MNIINSNLQFKGLSYGNNPDLILLHHAEASSCTVYDIHNWHLARGWAGCGYHYFVRKDGSIYTGRPENAIGAHCPNVNSHSIGICAEGAYMIEAMPEIQKQAIIDLCKYIKGKYNIQKILGHKEVPYPTDCPGINYPLDEIRDAVMNNISQPIEQSKPQTQDSEWIRSIQHLCNQLGIKGANGLPLDEDNIFGRNTEYAIKQLPVAKIQGYHNDLYTRWIQKRLGISVDGIFYKECDKAVRDYQASHGLSVDGQVGFNTIRRMIGVI